MNPRRDYITQDDLLAYGIDVETMRRWPIPEYSDQVGRSFWLLEDVLTVLEGGLE